MKFSFAVTTHNENEYIRKLLNQLTEHIKNNKLDYEIVVLDDLSDDPATIPILTEFAELPNVTVYRRKFEGDFSAHKNYLNNLCKGDYIFQLDADEMLAEYLLKNLEIVVGSNPRTDLFLIPRVNLVEGLTPEHIKKWGWTVTEQKWVNWPDYQTRLYKNKSGIHWEGKVHERIRGSEVWSALPDQKEFAIYHYKDIARQEKQNEMYAALQN